MNAPSRITSADMAVLGADVAEVVRDSRGGAWARWFSGASGSWSPWWPIAQGAEAVACAGPYGDGEPAALVSVARWKPDPQAESARPGRPLADSARGFYLLTAAGITATGL
jgi:hypothetical protein